MIGRLPTQLEVDGELYDIRTDYRMALLIFEAWNDPELLQEEKMIATLQILYEVVPENTSEAYEKAIWFLDCGQEHESSNSKPLYDWEQDEQMIFSAINKVAGHEVRADEYMHWWTFIAHFQSIGESLFSTVVNIRSKRNDGKKLDKVDQEFYAKNRKLIELHPKRTAEETKQLEAKKANILAMYPK